MVRKLSAAAYVLAIVLSTFIVLVAMHVPVNRVAYVGGPPNIPTVSKGISLSAPSPCPPRNKLFELREASLDRIQAARAPANAQTFLRSSDGDYCRRHPKAFLCKGLPGGRKLTYAEVVAIDSKLRWEFEYRSDMRLYGEEDRWEPRLCGDCEDYALLLAERLHKAGQTGREMGLLAWMAPQGAHATLLVNTSDRGEIEVGVGDFETPHTMNWDKGQRMGVLLFDGERNWMFPIK